MVYGAKSGYEDFLKLLKRTIVFVAVINDEFGGCGMWRVGVRWVNVKPTKGARRADVGANGRIDDPSDVFVRAVSGGGFPA